MSDLNKLELLIKSIFEKLRPADNAPCKGKIEPHINIFYRGGLYNICVYDKNEIPYASGQNSNLELAILETCNNFIKNYYNTNKKDTQSSFDLLVNSLIRNLGF